MPSATEIDSTPSTGLSVTSATPVSKKFLPSVAPAWCRPWPRRRSPRCPGGHQQRILLRGGADHAVGDVLNAGAAAVDRDDQHVVLAADRLERLIGAGGGRLVDRVDHVDHRVLGQQVLHRPAAAFLVAGGHVVADDARIGPRRPICSDRLTSMPKPGRKPWSRSTPTVGWLTARSSMRSWHWRRRRPGWLQPICRSVRRPGSCRWQRSRRRHRSAPAACRARSPADRHRAPAHGRDDGRGVRGGQQDALCAVGDAGLDRLRPGSRGRRRSLPA
jgi:hypothetical protein